MKSTPSMIDYETLIDPLCIPVIKFLREELGIDTWFCCQGRCLKGNSSHSSRGYVMAERTKESKDILLRLYELEETRWPMKNERENKAKFEIDSVRDSVTFWFPRRIFSTRKELKEEWDIILEELKKIKDDR